MKAYTDNYEQLTAGLAGAVNKILRKHGKNIIDKQFATRRLADIMIDMFVMACVISRVSSAMTEKGEKDTQHEREILSAFNWQVTSRIAENLRRIDDNDDEAIKSLADYAVEIERYAWDNLPKA